ncbi:MAG: ribulose-phosphate 3-epimerase [Leptospirales bacterium]
MSWLNRQRDIWIAPSLLAADFGNLAQEVKAVSEGGADCIHLDVMDGDFVPNLTFGPPIIRAIRSSTALPLEAHLMVWHPDSYLNDLKDAGVNRIIVHQESDVHLNRLLEKIREMGFSAGVAINPGTPVGHLEDVLDIVDLVLVMTVNPGFGGQSFIEGTLKKISRVRDLRQARPGRDFRIEVDGGIGTRTGHRVVEAGADLLVAGTAIFRNPPYGDAIDRLRQSTRPVPNDPCDRS